MAGSHRITAAVNDVSLDIFKGETLALVGESGSGKTTLGRCLLRLTPANNGSILYDGVDFLELPEKTFRPFRRKFQMIFQDPAQALNPMMAIKTNLEEPLRVHKGYRGIALESRVKELLDQVGLSTEIIYRLPHQLSGGQRQRVAIARALSLEPNFIIADEPMSSLDALHKQQIMELLIALKQQFSLTMVFITHDLAIAARMADRIAVMYQGKIVEFAETTRLIRSPAHPYSQKLVAAAGWFRKG